MSGEVARAQGRRFRTDIPQGRRFRADLPLWWPGYAALEVAAAGHPLYQIYTASDRGAGPSIPKPGIPVLHTGYEPPAPSVGV